MTELELLARELMLYGIIYKVVDLDISNESVLIFNIGDMEFLVSELPNGALSISRTDDTIFKLGNTANIGKISNINAQGAMTLIKLLPGFADILNPTGFVEQAAVTAILNPEAMDTRDFDDPVDLSILFGDKLG